MIKCKRSCDTESIKQPCDTMQVRQADVQSGEETALRRRLRQMETRQSSVQRCSVVATTQASLQEGLRTIQTQLNAILAEEEAQDDALAGTLSSVSLGHSGPTADVSALSAACAKAVDPSEYWCAGWQAGAGRYSGTEYF